MQIIKFTIARRSDAPVGVVQGDHVVTVGSGQLA